MSYSMRTVLPLAGPSRRGFASSCLWNSAPKRRQAVPANKAPPPPRHPSLPRAPAIPQQHGNAALAHEKMRTPPLQHAWPWRLVEKPSRPDVVEEERTLFARPFEMGRPRMYWFGCLASGLFFTAWLFGPPPARSLPPREGEERPRESPRDVFIYYASGVAVASAAVVSLGFLALPSRYITRLSLIRQTPTKSADSTSAKVFWRVKHAGQAMFSETSTRSLPRDVAIHDLNVRMIQGAGDRSPYLSLSIAEPNRPWASLDAWPYRMDYRDSTAVKQTDEEVVLSLNRVEHIFGRLDPGGKSMDAILVKGE